MYLTFDFLFFLFFIFKLILAFNLLRGRLNSILVSILDSTQSSDEILKQYFYVCNDRARENLIASINMDKQQCLEELKVTEEQIAGRNLFFFFVLLTVCPYCPV